MRGNENLGNLMQRLSRNRETSFAIHQIPFEPNSCLAQIKLIYTIAFKIAKNCIKNTYKAQEFHEDFHSSVPECVEIIGLSSDEEHEICDLSMTSVIDLQLSKEDDERDDEIMMMAHCVEIELFSPIHVPCPSTAMTVRNDAPPLPPIWPAMI